MRVAVLGAGSIGMRHIRNLLELGCKVFACDTSQDRLAQLPKGTHSFWMNPEGGWGFAADDYDAIVIAAPWDQHLSWAQFAIDCRVPLFVEKPLGPVPELNEWRLLAEQGRGLVTQAGYQCRFHRVAQAMGALVPADSGFFATACDMRTWPGKSYGPLLLEASHDLDLALSMGAPAIVTEAVIEPHYVAIQLGPHWRVTVEDHADYRREWTVEQRGQSMSATFRSPADLGTLMYHDELLHFLECVREGRQTECPLSDGVRVLEVCAQAEQLARKAA